MPKSMLVSMLCVDVRSKERNRNSIDLARNYSDDSPVLVCRSDLLVKLGIPDPASRLSEGGHVCGPVRVQHCQWEVCALVLCRHSDPVMLEYVLHLPILPTKHF